MVLMCIKDTIEDSGDEDGGMNVATATKPSKSEQEAETCQSNEHVPKLQHKASKSGGSKSSVPPLPTADSGSFSKSMTLTDANEVWLP